MSDGISDEAIKQRAYRLWEESGRKEGSALDFWLEAERQLKEEKESPDSAARSDTRPL